MARCARMLGAKGQSLGAAVCVTLCVLLCLAPLASGQYHIDSWTPNNGLPDVTVRGLLQDRNGYLTVERHRANICTKLNLRGSNILLRFAITHKSELS